MATIHTQSWAIHTRAKRHPPCSASKLRGQEHAARPPFSRAQAALVHAVSPLPATKICRTEGPLMRLER